MTKKEIAETIELLKRELAIFQKLAEDLGISENDLEKQINHYLDTLNKLKELQKKSLD